MLKINRVTKLLAFAAFSSAVLASNAHAANPTGTAADYGTSVAANPYDRKITISAQTKWVNVHDGETVQFDVGGKTFGWHFNTLTSTLRPIRPITAERLCRP